MAARCLLTAGVLTPSSRAAALRLPAPASAEKKPRSAGWMALLMATTVELKLTMISPQARASGACTA